ncbi:MAG: hypothetical protein KAH11_05285 [Rhodospirillales bacterium]|jgi:hypothetical protein|nr:hypothetical protein [Rhodospirillales bacterium]
MLHHRRHVGRARIHQFHRLRHGAGKVFVAGKCLDLAFPQVDVFLRQPFKVGPAVSRIFLVAHGPDVPILNAGFQYIVPLSAGKQPAPETIIMHPKKSYAAPAEFVADFSLQCNRFGVTVCSYGKGADHGEKAARYRYFRRR